MAPGGPVLADDSRETFPSHERFQIVDLQGKAVNPDSLKMSQPSIINPLWIWRQAAGVPVADFELVTEWFGSITWDDLHENREYIFWAWVPETEVFVACDNHPDFKFGWLPDGEAQFQFLDLQWAPEAVPTAPYVVQDVNCQGTSNGDIVGYDFTVFVRGNEATSCLPSDEDCSVVTELPGPWWGDVTFSLD